MPTVWIPSLMQKLTGGNGQVEVEGKTVRQIIEELDTMYPGFKDRLCEDDRLKPGMAVAVDGEVNSEGVRRKVPKNSVVILVEGILGF